MPVAAHAGSARPHDVTAARELLGDRLTDLPRVHAIVGDRAYRGLLKLAERKHVRLDIKAPPKGTVGFTPLWPLCTVRRTDAAAPSSMRERAMTQNGRSSCGGYPS